MANENGSNALSELSAALADAVERVSTSLVQVNGRKRQPASGVVFAENLVLTADHVLERDEDLSVGAPDGSMLEAHLVGRDMASDLAVLRVADLPATAATRAAEARVGQLVLAVGRPFGDPMASLGVVSAVGGPLRMRARRRRGRGGHLEQYLRTDAIPYPGFSGGPLTGASGEVLGILTTGLAPGVTLGIPSAHAWRIAESLAAQGRVRRGYLGISSQPVRLPDPLRSEREQRLGLLLVNVEEGSPASRSGLLLGDVLLSLDGETTEDTVDLQALLTGERVGTELPAEILRGGEVQSIAVEIGEKGA